MKKNHKFKETEIGMIPEDWEVRPIKELVKVNERSMSRDYIFSEIEYIDINSVEKGIINNRQLLLLEKAPSRARRIVRKNDIIISTVRPNLKHFAFIKDANNNTVVSTGFAVISSKKINPRFLYYYLTTDKYTEYLTAIADAHTSTYPSFNSDIIENSFVPYPSDEEQSAIAEILSSLDNRIELNQQMNATLEKIGQAIFKHWFIDFEFPDEKGRAYKSSGGEMVDSELGKIPKGWGVKPIDGIADFLNGLALQKYPPKNDEEYLPVIKIRELRQGVTESSDKANLNIPNEYIVTNGDILFSWSGSLDVVIWGFGKGALNQHLFKVTSRHYPKWLYYYWILKYLPEYKHIAEGKATTMGHIQRHHLTNSLVAVPDKTMLAKMDNILTPIINKIVELKTESRNLSQIRDSLLPRLMSGRIRVQ